MTAVLSTTAPCYLRNSGHLDAVLKGKRGVQRINPVRFPMRSIMTSLTIVAVLVSGMLSAVVFATI
jgi:hypothetical protein